MGPGPGVTPEIDHHQGLLGDAYRSQYLYAVEQYESLPTFIMMLNGISTDLLNAPNVTSDDKVLIYSEIELLKQFATDIETNFDYWVDLYAPLEDDAQMNSSITKNNIIMSTKIGGINGKIMGPPYRGNIKRQGCKVSARNVMMAGILGGLVSGSIAAKAEAVAGTVVVFLELEQ